jgi:biotin carboxylase
MKSLILGGGHSEYPIILSSNLKNVETTTVGTKLYFKVPFEKHVFADYSDPNIVIDICKQKNIERLISGCNDFSAITAALVAEELGIAHEISAKNAIEIHNKDLWAKTFHQLSIPIPKYEIVTPKSKSKLTLSKKWNSQDRIIVKPVDMTGGKGIVLTDISTLENNFEFPENISRQQKFLIQEFTEGTLHSAFTVFSSDQNVTFFADEQIDETFRVNIAVVPSGLNEGIKNEVKSVIHSYLKHLKLERGMFHIQFIQREGKFQIIDICARPPGDLFFLLMKFKYGFDFSKYWIRPMEISEEANMRSDNSYVVRFVAGVNSDLHQEYKKNVIAQYQLLYRSKRSKELESHGEILFLKFVNLNELNQFISVNTVSARNLR